MVERRRTEESVIDGKAVSRTTKSYETRSLPLAASDVSVKLALEHRQKGLPTSKPRR